MATNVDYCNFFFELKSDENNVQYKHCTMCSCKRKYIQGNGQTNYLTHLATQHPDYIEIYKREKEIAKKNSKPMDKFLKRAASKKAINIYSWIEWVLDDNLPFLFVESENTRANTTLDHISRKTIMKYISALANKLRDKVTKILKNGKTFGLIVDGWAHGSDHYMAMYATLMLHDHNGDEDVAELLLSCNVQADVGEDTIFAEGFDGDNSLHGLTAEDLFDHIVSVLHDEYEIAVYFKFIYECFYFMILLFD